VQSHPRRPQFSARPEGSSANVTSAIGMEETFGRSRARRTSLFTRSVLWITGLVCAAFLLGTFAQAWSNNNFIAQVSKEQQTLNQLQTQHDQLQKEAQHYQDPAVIESEARQQFGYIHTGEQPIVVTGTNSGGTTKAQKASKPAPQAGFWNAWWQLFFGPSNQ
jgi:cell division protein FtsB